MYENPNYSRGTMAYMWLTQVVLQVAEQIYTQKADAL